jgi:hypothetical protein
LINYTGPKLILNHRERRVVMAEPLTLLGVERKEAAAPARLWWLLVLVSSVLLWAGIGVAVAAVLHYLG